MKKILIVYPYSNLSTNPTMVALVESLMKSGFHVDLIVDTSHSDQFPTFESSGQALRQLHFNDRLWWQPASSGIAKSLYRVLRQPLAIDPTWFNRVAVKQYCCVIGVDPLGVATAYQLNSTAKLPLVYISFEILLADEAVGLEETRLKEAEKRAAQASDLILIQDPDRAGVLANDNDLNIDKFCYVPVAPAGRLPENTDYLRQQLGIPTAQSIVLFQGTIAAWSGRDEWEFLLNAWGDRVALVVHSRRNIGARDQKFLDRLAAKHPVYVSDQPVSADVLPTLIASADVGLVSYFPNPDHWHTYGNLNPLGLASGKLASFLMCGVPVLANRRTSLGQLISENDLGATYESADTSLDDLQRILDTREQLSKSARKFYDEVLDPTEPIANFIDRIAGL